MKGDVEAEALRVTLQAKMRESEAQEATIARLVADVQRLQRDCRDLAELLEAARPFADAADLLEPGSVVEMRPGIYGGFVEMTTDDFERLAAVVRRRQEEPGRSVKLERER